MPLSPILRLGLRALLWLPLCLALWWLWLKSWLLGLLYVGVALGVEWLLADQAYGLLAQDQVWLLLSSLMLAEDPLRPLVLMLDPLRFTVAFPLFWGLVLATPGLARLERCVQLVWGSALLWLLVTALLLIYVQFKLALNVNQQPLMADRPSTDYLLTLPYSALVYYLLGVGRQLAVLVAPTFAPLLLWLYYNHRLLREWWLTVGRAP
ncbi:MAG TPA: exosortase H-associated membrane protein [Candidatus Competibacteraceae bacterium]|nr:exosortase H-associated membrane protein [Candidatus Competibacteraceae bacterium]